MAGAQISERRMHLVRWLLTAGWLLIIVSLFFDPFTARLTDPQHPWSPLRLSGGCVPVQGRCLVETPYPLGPTIFWGAVVPSAIFVLLVFGHELWRRICPLSFISQLPRALGWQRQIARTNPKTGEIRRQLARVPAQSWLAKNYSSLQFAWLFIGLCGRILFFNADRLVLAGWLLFSIAAALAVGWLYGGKSWCQYFCPMAPVQAVYSTPTSLLGSRAHLSPRPISQSMCRSTTASGDEQSACVACQQPCIDIDAERLYWARLNTPSFAFERYAYVGLVVGYFFYYYLYAGSWDYYFSGAWSRQPDQLAMLLSPGLFLFGQVINVPRLVAVPLVLGLFTWLGWLTGRAIEAWMRRRVRQQGETPDIQLIRHRVFLAATFLVFNTFFLFAGRPLLQLAPLWLQSLFDTSLVATSTLWLVRCWHRSPALYERENLAERFRRQLEKLGLDVAPFLEGRRLRDLNPDEVYVLARVLPGFGGQQRQAAYKGVVREALAEGYVNVASSLEVLRQMRQQLAISDDEHRQVLDELGVEDPALLDPEQRRSLEEQVRLSGYRRALERLLRLQSQVGDASLAGPGASSQAEVQLAALRRQFAISPGEEVLARQQLAPGEAARQRAELLLRRLEELSRSTGWLRQPALAGQPQLQALLLDQLLHRQEHSLEALAECLLRLGADPAAAPLRSALAALAPQLPEELQGGEQLRQLLPAMFADGLSPAAWGSASPASDADSPLPTLRRLVQDDNPIVAATALALLASLDRDEGRALAGQLQQEPQRPGWLRATAERLQALEGPLLLSALPELDKRVALATSDFFRRTWVDTLDLLADRAEIRVYAAETLITEPADTCRELLLLIEGAARVERRQGEELSQQPMRPGQVLDELEVLSHSASENKIVAETTGTRVLAVPVDCFDATLERDPDFARRVLALESRQLQRLTRTLAESAGGVG